MRLLAVHETMLETEAGMTVSADAVVVPCRDRLS